MNTPAAPIQPGPSPGRTSKIEPVVQLALGSPAGQLRAVPVALGPGQPRAILTIHAADYDVDPWTEMFFFPTDTPKLTLFTGTGEILWRRDLGPGLVPGMWFLPVFPFDLDGDGVDEIWLVNNDDPDHPLSFRHRVLERLDARTGAPLGRWPWPCGGGEQPLSHTFRNFILGGYVRGEPVLVTAQGTYGPMFLQGRRPDMTVRWERAIAPDAPGARGGHMCPVTDLDGDSVNEVLWGERCIEFDAGTELFCADRDCYRGHSDVVQPVLESSSGQWFIYTCRESDEAASPRVVLFDGAGRRVWGQVDRGHIDMGWVARLGDDRRHVAAAIRISHKTSGAAGHAHLDREEFTFDALTGQPVRLPFSIYRAVPVDLDGDGLHELVYGAYQATGEVIDRHGRSLGRLPGRVAMVGRFLDLPGEQVLQFDPDGTVRVWADRNAQDSPAALARYSHPLYRLNQRLSASGANGKVLAGL